MKLLQFLKRFGPWQSDSQVGSTASCCIFRNTKKSWWRESETSSCVINVHICFRVKIEKNIKVSESFKLLHSAHLECINMMVLQRHSTYACCHLTVCSSMWWHWHGQPTVSSDGGLQQHRQVCQLHQNQRQPGVPHYWDQRVRADQNDKDLEAVEECNCDHVWIISCLKRKGFNGGSPGLTVLKWNMLMHLKKN